MASKHPELTSRTATQLGRTSGMPSNHCEGVKPKPLASRGALHCMCPIVLAELTALYQCVLRFWHSACYAKRHLNVQKCSEPVPFDLEMCFAPTACTFSTSQPPKWSEHGVLCTFWLGNVLRATTPCTFSTSQLPNVVRHWNVLRILTWKSASRHNGVHFSICQLPKVVRTWCALRILICKCASRQNGVHFFDITTSKSAPKLRCFVHFDFEMCFAPQRRAICQISTSKSALNPSVFYIHFWLRNVLRATTAWNFSSLIWPDGSAPAALAYFSTLRTHKSLEKRSV